MDLNLGTLISTTVTENKSNVQAVTRHAFAASNGTLILSTVPWLSVSLRERVTFSLNIVTILVLYEFQTVVLLIFYLAIAVIH